MDASYRFRLASQMVVVVLLTVSVMTAPALHSASAQENGLTLSITPSTTKAKVGDYIAFDVRVENVGTETITGLVYGIGLPDALNGQSATCCGTELSVVTCQLEFDFSPGSIAGALFFVQVGSREPNGAVTAFANAGGKVMANATIPAIKIVGQSKPR